MLDKIHTFPTSATDEQIAYTLRELSYARIDNWLDTDFLTWGWWLELGVLIVSVTIFWKLVDKKRLFELTYHVISAGVIVIWLDQVGFELGLWYYPVDLIPVFPPATAFDYTLLPVAYTLIYQYCPKWPRFLMATLIMAGVVAFLMEPMAHRWGFYELVKWKYYYGFPVYIAIGIFLKLVTEKMKAIVAKQQAVAK